MAEGGGAKDASQLGGGGAGSSTDADLSCVWKWDIDDLDANDASADGCADKNHCSLLQALVVEGGGANDASQLGGGGGGSSTDADLSCVWQGDVNDLEANNTGADGCADKNDRLLL